jgi:hypothetical protein
MTNHQPVIQAAVKLREAVRAQQELALRKRIVADRQDDQYGTKARGIEEEIKQAAWEFDRAMERVEL